VANSKHICTAKKDPSTKKISVFKTARFCMKISGTIKEEMRYK